MCILLLIIFPLFSIGDLHTDRRQQKKLIIRQLPPLEMRVKNPSEPVFTKIILPRKKIILAPFGPAWSDIGVGSRVFRLFFLIFFKYYKKFRHFIFFLPEHPSR